MPIPQVLLGVASVAAMALDAAKDPKVQAAAKAAWEHKDEIRDTAAPVVKKATEIGVAAGSKAAEIMGSAAAGAAKVAGDVTDSAAETMKASAEKRAQEKALAEARQQLLQSATAKMKAVDFEAEWDKAQQTGTIAPLKSPGYFVIAVYKSKPIESRLHDYKEVFVSRSENTGASLHRHLSGEGNPDVYADMKYGQHLLVFAFPDFDFEDDNNETLRQFVTALRADVSYNARVSDSLRDDARTSIEVTGALASVERALNALETSFGRPEVIHEELCGEGLTVKALEFCLNEQAR